MSLEAAYSALTPWSMSWGRACPCGPSWPSFATQWWVSSSSSSLSSCTKPARCLHVKRRLQRSHRRSRPTLSTSTCWRLPDVALLRSHFFLIYFSKLSLSPFRGFFCFLLCLCLTIQWLAEQQTCGRTKNNKQGPQSSYLCRASLGPSICQLVCFALCRRTMIPYFTPFFCSSTFETGRMPWRGKCESLTDSHWSIWVDGLAWQSQ